MGERRRDALGDEAWQRLRERIALKIQLLEVGELAELRRQLSGRLRRSWT